MPAGLKGVDGGVGFEPEVAICGSVVSAVSPVLDGRGSDPGRVYEHGTVAVIVIYAVFELIATSLDRGVGAAHSPGKTAGTVKLQTVVYAVSMHTP